MRTPEEVATDYNGRRAGILKALVDDVEQFYQCCDPERENLCLYGNQDGTWEVALPAEEVPPEMPEPSLGINFARNGMQSPRQEDDDEEEEEEGPGSDYADGEGDPCPNCGRVYRAGEFWIACDFCDTWYDGKCVQMTPVKAQRMGRWKCPQCTGYL